LGLPGLPSPEDITTTCYARTAISQLLEPRPSPSLGTWNNKGSRL